MALEHARRSPDRSPSRSALVEVGRVARAHGVRGEVRVVLHWPASDLLLELSEVVVEPAGQPARAVGIEAARRADRALLVKFAGVADRDAAAALRGARVLVPRATLPVPADGEFYLFDLVGARVVDPAGELGEVVEVRTHPSVDCLVIRTDSGNLVEQPLVFPWFERVDLAARRVHLSGRDGLIE
jgi:16S rRNA processing protein RimM